MLTVELPGSPPVQVQLLMHFGPPGGAGPAGPPGPPGPPGVLAATLNTAGTLQPMTGTARWYPPRDVSFDSIEAWVGSAPSGADLVVELRLNGGSSVMTITIPEGQFGILPITGLSGDISPPDYLTANINQVGSSEPGSDLSIRVIFK